MSFEDFIDEEDIEFVNELENPKKYHYEEHSDDTIHFYEDGEEILYGEVVDLLNGQETIICNLNKSLSTSLPVWVVEKVINRRIKATSDDTVKKELKKLLNELL